MLWRKILDHNPRFVLFSDKLAAKNFIQSRCPDLPVPKTLWIGDNSDDIPDHLLRSNAWLKANHGCGFNRALDAGPCDRQTLRQITQRWLHSHYGRKNGEWAYSQISPKLFLEESVGNAHADLLEFNVRAAGGRAVLGSVMGHAKTPAQWAVYLDPQGHPTLGMKDPDGTPIPTLPQGLDILEPYFRAVHYAEILSRGVDYARFDFFYNGAQLFGGEITVYPAAGLDDPANSFNNTVILSGWDLLQSHFLNQPHTGWKRVYADALRRRFQEFPPFPPR